MTSTEDTGPRFNPHTGEPLRFNPQPGQPVDHETGSAPDPVLTTQPSSVQPLVLVRARTRIRRLLSTPEGKVGAVCASVLVLVLLVGGMIGLASNGSSNSYAGYGDTTSSTSSSIDSSVTRYGCSLATLTNDTCTIRHLIAAYCNTKVGNVIRITRRIPATLRACTHGPT